MTKGYPKPHILKLKAKMIGLIKEHKDKFNYVEYEEKNNDFSGTFVILDKRYKFYWENFINRDESKRLKLWDMKGNTIYRKEIKEMFMEVKKAILNL